MADEKKGGKAGEMLSKHFDKILLAMAALALLVYLVMGVFMAAPNASYGKIDGHLEKLSGEGSVAHPNFQADPAGKFVPGAIDPWNEVTSSRSAGNWTGALLPEAIGSPILPVRVAVFTTWIPGIAFQGAEVALDGVTVGWSVAPPMDPSEARLKLINVKTLTSFKLERKVGATGKWEVLEADMPVETLSYVDRRIDPRTDYSYRVTSYCTDAEYVKNNRNSTVGMTVGTSEPVMTQGIWELSFNNAMQIKGKGMVYVEIQKFDKVHGKVKIRHMQTVGDKIGWWRKNPSDEDSEPVSLHRAHVGFRSVTIDFNTGMILKSVKPKKLQVEQTMCKPIVKEGGYVRCDTVTRKNSVRFRGLPR